MERFASVHERDVDLLLLEEFHCSERFRRWFVEQVKGSGIDAGAFRGAWHSVTNAKWGESDLEVAFAGSDGRGWMLLIEDKIDAFMQPDQARRYRERGRAYEESGRCGSFKTVIVAPEGYLVPEDQQFDAVITYESLREWFLREGGPRGEYRAGLVSAAIEEARRGYQRIPDPRTTEFLDRYWALANTVAPELGMRRPTKPRPKGSGWVYFKPASLPDSVGIFHKMQNGCVDLQFGGVTSETLEAQYGHLLLPGMVVTAAAKSSMIRVSVPPIDPDGDFEAQKSVVREGLEAALNVYHWLLGQRERVPT